MSLRNDLAEVWTLGGMNIVTLLRRLYDETTRDDVTGYAAQLAVNLARERVQERMNPGDQETLVRNFVTELSREGRSP